MRAIRGFLSVAAICLSAFPGIAQEGFPLDGTWRGQWGSAGSQANHVVIVMKWNGDTVTGRINPGPNSIDFREARLEPSDWGVHIAAISTEGEPIRIDGTLADIGSWNRRLTGTWRVGDAVYDFQITRE